MATRTLYGKTWWGAKWLESFAQIDTQNRLARGKTLANKSAVNGLQIYKNGIQANVAETPSGTTQTHRVQISTPNLQPEQIKILEKILEENL